MRTEHELIAALAELLDTDGWEVEVAKAIDGIQLDVLAKKDSERVLVIECKAYTRLLGLRTAREFASVVMFLRETDPDLDAWLVTTRGFTSKAKEVLQRFGISGFTVREVEQKFGTSAGRPSKTVEAWVKDVNAAQKNKKRIFVIMPFSETMLDVFILGIRWAASQLGVIAERADDLEHNGDIIEEVRDAIRSYDVVVGDTSGANPNVCYEVGFAHALDKPTILICRTGEELPFDLQGTNHLIYSNVVGLREPLKRKLQTSLGLEDESESKQNT